MVGLLAQADQALRRGREPAGRGDSGSWLDVLRGAQGTLAGHVLEACCFRGGDQLRAAEAIGENVVVTNRAQAVISNGKASDLSACKWLRARAMCLEQIDHEGEHL